MKLTIFETDLAGNVKVQYKFDLSEVDVQVGSTHHHTILKFKMVDSLGARTMIQALTPNQHFQLHGEKISMI